MSGITIEDAKRIILNEFEKRWVFTCWFGAGEGNWTLYLCCSDLKERIKPLINLSASEFSE
jgi:hypothetical protein